VSSAEPLGIAAGTRIGATFRLLMEVRILVALVSLLLVPRERRTLEAVLLVIGIGLLSGLALFGWRQIVPWLLRLPVLLGLDVFVSYAALEIGGVLGPFFLFTVITSAVAGLLHRWQGMLLVCVLQMLLYYVAVVADYAQVAPSFQTAFAMPAFYPIVGFLGTGLRRLYDQYTLLDDARHHAEIVATAAEERARLAREMHDSLAKTLRGISMSAAALPVWTKTSPVRAEREARQIASAAEIASREARQLIEDLRDDVVRQPLAVALDEVVASWAGSAGLAAATTVAPDVDLPLRDRYELVAIVKEALENVHRHAGAASVEVGLVRDGGRVVLTVRDDGRGFAAAGDIGELARDGHYGLIGMRERAARVGAALTLASEPGAGTTVTVTLPAVPEAPDRRPAVEVA
jgi:signal transduction histidine kinase